MFVDSFAKCLSPVEEDFVVDIIRKKMKMNLLIFFKDLSADQKPLLMISSLQPFLQQLKQYPQWQTFLPV